MTTGRRIPIRRLEQDLRTIHAVGEDPARAMPLIDALLARLRASVGTSRPRTRHRYLSQPWTTDEWILALGEIRDLYQTARLRSIVRAADWVRGLADEANDQRTEVLADGCLHLI